MWYPVISLSALAKKSSYGFEVVVGSDIIDAFIVQSEGQWYAYRNQCPHQHLPLNWNPHQFLDQDDSLIVCAMHLALFLPQTGACVRGPCYGKSLPSLALSIVDQVVWVEIES